MIYVIPMIEPAVYSAIYVSSYNDVIGRALRMTVRGGIHRLSDGERILDLEITRDNEYHVKYSATHLWSEYGRPVPPDADYRFHDAEDGMWNIERMAFLGVRKCLRAMCREIKVPDTMTRSDEFMIGDFKELMYLNIDYIEGHEYNGSDVTDDCVRMCRIYAMRMITALRWIRRSIGLEFPPMFRDESVKRTMQIECLTERSNSWDNDMTIDLIPIQGGMKYVMWTDGAITGTRHTWASGTLSRGASFMDLVADIRQSGERLVHAKVMSITTESGGTVEPHEVKPY